MSGYVRCIESEEQDSPDPLDLLEVPEFSSSSRERELSVKEWELLLDETTFVEDLQDQTWTCYRHNFVKLMEVDSKTPVGTSSIYFFGR